MNAEIRSLKADIRRDLAAIQEIYGLLDPYPVPPVGVEPTIAVGFYLHNLYTAFESIFERVAEVFENHISNNASWHSELLRRMTLDVEGIRPRVISEAAYDCLDEMRRFRHLYRGAYRTRLDPRRLALVQEMAQTLEKLYQPDLALFLDFLESLS